MASDRAFVDAANSSEIALQNGASFTGQWQERKEPYGLNLLIALTADKPCSYAVEFSTNQNHIDSTLSYIYNFGGIELEAKADFRLRITTCSANNTPVFGRLDYVLVRQ